MFFESWGDLWRVAVVGTLAYASLVLLLRISGKRTLTKLNAFDLVITVALGSTLATVLLSKEASLAEGIVALSLLIGLQYAITWLSVRSPRFQGFIKAEPKLLVHGGQFLDSALKEERITREELLAAMRADGVADAADVASVVLETDGSISIIVKSASAADAPTLATVEAGAHPLH